MSVARVHRQTARKDQGKCEKCGKPLPRGTEYLWFSIGFRSHYKHRRCTGSACAPKMSELESSAMSAIYAAQEDAEETIRSAEPGDWSTISDAISSVNEAIQEVAQQYRDADEAFGGYGATESGEKADTLESAEVEESYEDEFEDWCEEHQDETEWEQAQDEKPESERLGLDEAREVCEDCQQGLSDWWNDKQEEAVAAVWDVDLG